MALGETRQPINIACDIEGQSKMTSVISGGFQLTEKCTSLAEMGTNFSSIVQTVGQDTMIARG